MATGNPSPRLTREQAQWFRSRWLAVDEIELAELKAMPVDVKFRQLAGLMASGRALGWLNDPRLGDDETRDRWQRLRRSYAVTHGKS